jgi:hypothetical protein
MSKFGRAGFTTLLDVTETFQYTDEHAAYALGPYSGEANAEQKILGGHAFNGIEVANDATLIANGIAANLLCDANIPDDKGTATKYEYHITGEGNVTIIANFGDEVNTGKTDNLVTVNQTFHIETKGTNVIAAGAGADVIHLGKTDDGANTGDDILIFAKGDSTVIASTANGETTYTKAWDVVHDFDKDTDKLVFAEKFEADTDSFLKPVNVAAELVVAKSDTAVDLIAGSITWNNGEITYSNGTESISKILSDILTALDGKIGSPQGGTNSTDTSADKLEVSAKAGTAPTTGVDHTYSANEVWFYMSGDSTFILKADGNGDDTTPDHSGDMVIELADVNDLTQAQLITLLGVTENDITCGVTATE